MTQIQDHGWEVWVTHAATSGRTARGERTLLVGWYRTEEEALAKAQAFQAEPTFKPEAMTLTVKHLTKTPLRTVKRVNPLWL